MLRRYLPAPSIPTTVALPAIGVNTQNLIFNVPNSAILQQFDKTQASADFFNPW